MHQRKDWWNVATLVSCVIQYMFSKDRMFVSDEYRIMKERVGGRGAAIF
jgi:hypothetical protein